MSGGVGPTCNDINLSKEEEYEQKQSYDAISTKYPTSPRKAGFLSFQQLKAVAVILIFSASGMVSPEDFAFVFFSLLYMYFISKVAFPIPTLPYSSKEPEPPGPVFSTRESKLLRLYVFVAAIIGLFLPIAYIFHGIFEGDKEGIKAATPHVFLLSSQVFMEGVASSDRFSLPIRVFVPVCYNARRIFTIVDWLRSEVSKVDEEYGGSKTRLYVGRSLAIANLAFWCFNLFGFLLPVLLPRAFRRYFSGHKVKD